MAFKATKEVGEAGPELTGTVRGIANSCTSFKSTSLQGAVSATQVLSLLSVIVEGILKIDDLKTTPGLADYYKEAYDDPNYDVVPEFNNMLDALELLRLKIATDLPRSVSGYLDTQTLSSQGVLTDREFSSAATQGIRIRIDVFLTTVIL